MCDWEICIHMVILITHHIKIVYWGLMCCALICVCERLYNWGACTHVIMLTNDGHMSAPLSRARGHAQRDAYHIDPLYTILMDCAPQCTLARATPLNSADCYLKRAFLVAHIETHRSVFIYILFNDWMEKKKRKERLFTKKSKGKWSWFRKVNHANAFLRGSDIFIYLITVSWINP